VTTASAARAHRSRSPWPCRRAASRSTGPGKRPSTSSGRTTVV